MRGGNEALQFLTVQLWTDGDGGEIARETRVLKTGFAASSYGTRDTSFRIIQMLNIVGNGQTLHSDDSVELLNQPSLNPGLP